MKKPLLILFLLCLLSHHSMYGEKNVNPDTTSFFEGHVLIEEGACCWFADPRALHYQNEELNIHKTYVGCIDIHGAIKGIQYDHTTGTKEEILIRSYFQPDDHNNPTFLALPDGRIVVFYSRHTDEPCFYYRISQKPGDITTLGGENRLETSHNTTYPSPFILSDDPEHIYLCWRGINWHPTIARLTLPDSNGQIYFDKEPVQIVQSTGARPYAKYVSNGKDKIYLTYTTGHPDNEDINFVYLNYVDVIDFTLRDIQGKKLSTLNDVIHSVDATEGYSSRNQVAVVNDEPFRNWIWQVVLDAEENPVIAMVRINEDKKSHDYYYIKWDGEEWCKFFLDHAGGHFHQSPDIELCYSGGMTIDPANPGIIYSSVPVGGVFEIMKYQIGTNGDIKKKPITFNSHKNNIRPYLIPGSRNSPLRLIWMHGDYYDWIVSSVRPGYPTAIHSQECLGVVQKNQIPVLYPGDSIRVTGSYGNFESIIPDNPTEFTLLITICKSDFPKGGTLLRMSDLMYGIEGDRPYIQSGTQHYRSNNVLGNSEVWRTLPRATDGKWPPFKPYPIFQLACTFKQGIFKTFINGLVDQSIDMDSPLNIELPVSDIQTKSVLFFKRALNQTEIQQLIDCHE